jgi:outer membrane protein TolC
MLLATLIGCTRSRYRRAADDEVYSLIQRGACDPRWALEDYAITPDPTSRMYDPDSPDRPPMPPDDPTSHELMKCVEGMKGWKHWDRNGHTPYAENPDWLQGLSRDSEGVVVLDRAAAVQVALLNSREYQRELEDLYLSALDVTYERFRFDLQFFGGNATFFTADGPDRAGGGGSSSLLSVDTGLEARKLSATGADLVVGAANSLVWQFAGPDQNSATTLLDFSLVQPLLRAGGRAVVLENLTQSERTLLANIRQMERFRSGFYSQIIAGINPGIGPARGGFSVADFNPSSGISGGVLDLMESQVRIRNQRFNVVGLRRSLDQFEAFLDADRIDSLQVDQARQALYNAQSTLMSLASGYQDSLDSYKITLGLPPQADVRIGDPLLNRFDLIDSQTTAMQEGITRLLSKLRDKEAAVNLQEYATALEYLPTQCRTVLSVIEDDMQTLDRTVPERLAFLQLLSTRKELADGDVDLSVADVAAFQERLAVVREGFDKQRSALLAALDEWENVRLRSAGSADAAVEKPEGDGGDAQGTEWQVQAVEILTRLDDCLSELAILQARCRVECIVLIPVQMRSDEAFEIARQNRLDWMNARAALVDTWRQVEVAANALKGDMSVMFSGDMSTVGNNPVAFRSTTGRLRVGLQFDPPLTRLAERTAYRAALIDYQQAKRQYCAYEDRVSQNLRNMLRAIDRSQLDFELRRAGIYNAISQVDVMQLRLKKPPQPGQLSVFGATTARDLVQALSGLLSAENSFVAAWVDYETQRMNLDFNLGTMQLDAQGNWTDPGPLWAKELQTPGETPPIPTSEEIPAPASLPLET